MPAPPPAVLWAVGRVYGRKCETEPPSHYRRDSASGSQATAQALVIKVQLREPRAAWGWGGPVPTPPGLGSLGLQLRQQLITSAKKDVPRGRNLQQVVFGGRKIKTALWVSVLLGGCGLYPESHPGPVWGAPPIFCPSQSWGPFVVWDTLPTHTPVLFLALLSWVPAGHMVEPSLMQAEPIGAVLINAMSPPPMKKENAGWYIPIVDADFPCWALKWTSWGSGQYLYDQGQARQAVSGLFSRWS